MSPPCSRNSTPTGPDKVAVQLAHHYDLARLDDRAALAYLQAGRSALGMFAHREALSLATRGMDCLNRSGEGHRHAALLLDLHLLQAEALRHDGQFVECMSRFRQAAELAMAFGAPEALARAALGYDEPRWRCNLEEPYANVLLERALARIGTGDSVLRVYLMAHLARGRQDSMPASERTDLLDGAVAMARRLDDPRALIESLRLRLSVDRSPDGIDWRVDTLAEMLQLAQRIDDKQLTMEVLAFRIYDLVALGDVARWNSDVDAHQRLADAVGEPFYTYSARAMAVAQVINAGRFPEAERMAGEAHAIGQQLGVDTVEGALGVQMFTIRREQGRLREVAPFVQHFVEDRGAGAAWRPGLAVIYADVERHADAAAEFERLAAEDFASIPRDSLWQASLCYLVDVCDYLQDAERAAIAVRHAAALRPAHRGAGQCDGLPRRDLALPWAAGLDDGALGGRRGTLRARTRLERAHGGGAMVGAHSLSVFPLC